MASAVVYRIAVKHGDTSFTWRDPFDGVDDARATLAETGVEFPGSTAHVEELTAKGWVPVDGPVKRKGRWPFRKR